MALYFGFEPSSQQDVAKSLRARDIHLIRAAPSDVHVTVARTFNQPAYLAYTKYFPAYIYATLQQKKVDVRQFGYRIQYPLKDAFPFSYPNIALTLKNKNAAFHQRLVDTGAKVERIKGAETYLFPDPNAKLLSGLYKDKSAYNITASCPENHVNIFALDELRVTIQIFSGFLVTHQYPAFKDPEHVISIESLTLSEAPNTGKRRILDDDEERTAEKRRRGNEGGVIEDVDSHMEGPKTVADVISSYITVALPQSSGFIGWGASSDLPADLYGLFFPFALELAAFDHRQVPACIERHFLGCLGSTEQAIHEGMARMRSAWGNISKTAIGKELTHMSKCLDIGIDSQSRVYPIFENGRYEGCAVLGYGYSISVGKKVFRPLPPTELKQVIDNHSGYSSTLRSILKALDFDMDDEDDDGMAILKNPNLSMEKLRRVCINSEVTEATKERVLQLATALSFTKYPSHGVNPLTLTQSLDLIADPSLDVPSDWPTHHTQLFTTDRIAVIWSGFGFYAPTFRPDSGVPVSLQKLEFTSYKRGGGTAERVTQRLSQLVVRQVELTTAIRDLKEVIRTKEIRHLVQNRRSGIYADRVYTKADFDRILGALQKVARVGTEAVDNQGLGDLGLQVESDMPADDENF